MGIDDIRRRDRAAQRVVPRADRHGRCVAGEGGRHVARSRSPGAGSIDVLKALGVCEAVRRPLPTPRSRPRFAGIRADLLFGARRSPARSPAGLDLWRERAAADQQATFRRASRAAEGADSRRSSTDYRSDWRRRAQRSSIRRRLAALHRAMVRQWPSLHMVGIDPSSHVAGDRAAARAEAPALRRRSSCQYSALRILATSLPMTSAFISQPSSSRDGSIARIRRSRGRACVPRGCRCFPMLDPRRMTR